MNLGSYYTSPYLVNIAYNLIKNYINIKNFAILDNSCGYGEFLKITHTRLIGADIDSKIPNKSIKIINALVNPNRKNYDIKNNEKLIIVGNPPYNDKTSKSKKHLKEINYEVDDELKHRDIGISFLKSYVKLNPDYICILHPLSYLIKQQNFKSLKEFKDNYILKDGIIISSKYFTKGSEFPIIIGFYEKGQMDFEYIQHFLFKTEEGFSFKLSDYEFIGNFINKYPNKKKIAKEKIVGYFYTLRDINALKRNKTFLQEPNNNTIYIQEEKMNYFYYIDVFKKNFIKNVPYYFG
ncbi:adenine methyltransferase, partial [Campylobacter jejuni]|nr:adenine methyltransferase [Campylobacter jejuni]